MYLIENTDKLPCKDCGAILDYYTKTMKNEDGTCRHIPLAVPDNDRLTSMKFVPVPADYSGEIVVSA